MQPPFDISADLDTPVSTYLKLAPLQPRFLLESVERGAQLGRYSFLGFGAVTEFRLDADGVRTGGQQRPRPNSQAELLDLLRQTLAETPRLEPAVPDLPFGGGLVGVAAYDLVRHFERLPNPPAGAACPPSPEAAYLATESLLWILDEPFTSLDRASMALFADLFEQQLQRGGLIVVTSHHEIDLPRQSVKRLNLGQAA